METSLLINWLQNRLMVEFKDLTFEGSDSKFHYFTINKNKVIGDLSIEFNFRVSLKEGTLEISNKKGGWVYVDKFIY